MSRRTDSNVVKTARTTFEILETLKERDQATVAELTEEFDLSKSSIHNYLNTLQQDGYVVKEGDTYRVGLRLLDLGGHARHRHYHELYDVAKPEVTTLAHDTGELVNLMVEEDGMGFYLYRAGGDDAIKTEAYNGLRTRLHGTALGQTILAHYSRQRVTEILDRHGMPSYTEHTITDRGKLFEKLERVSEAGYAIDDEERIDGLRCVAVPIVNNDGGVEGAVSVAGPVTRLQEDWIQDELVTKLRNVANVIELNTTYV